MKEMTPLRCHSRHHRGLSQRSCRPFTDQRPRQWSRAARGRGAQRLALLGQALFIVPAGKVAVITTLGKVSGGRACQA